eukprot:TRINITY_DN746_c0_g1_i1.p1 TRINITY_DN746_c0_g1~~TRINITY_DN746_c0_g1_i1.p1  ORF type:complete len:451 (+),score=104.96 TRINITY_DN746_c0_g1_i1:150-1502(+)
MSNNYSIPHVCTSLPSSPGPRRLSIRSPCLHPTPSQYRDFLRRRVSLTPDGKQLAAPIIYSTPSSPSLGCRSPKYIYHPATRRTSVIDPADLISVFPEEILLYIFSFLDVTDLFFVCQVSYTWNRLCEDEFIFRNICQRCFPCLGDTTHPPFERTWHTFYEQKKRSFGVLGGPTAQSSCMDDVITKLRSAGLPVVDSHFTQKRIPTLDELQKYSSVLVYSYNSSAFLDGTLIGDVLADYVDNGGGVVVTVFTNCNNLRNGFIKGRFYEQGYHPITPSRQHDTNGKKPLTLGKIVDPTHPIMEGVRSLDGGRSSFFCPGALNPDSKLIAEWSNGVPLVAELQKGKGRVVVLNFFPPSSDTGDPRFWLSSTDGDVLLANALAYVGRSSVLKKARLSWNSQQWVGANEDPKQAGATPDYASSSREEKLKKERRHRQIGKRILSKLFTSLRKNE